jgi:thioredoxin reductase (NADPH)
MDIHPVAVIGAGPAGLAAAMQLSRQGSPALVFERDQVGGLLWNANWVENYPGFPEGISGPDLVKRFALQAERLGVKIRPEGVIEATYLEEGIFDLRTESGEYQASVLIAATGTKPRALRQTLIPHEAIGRVFSEVFPLQDVCGKEIIIVGAGDAAFDYALNLSRNNQVHILNRGSGIKSLNLLRERALGHPAIRYHPLTEISAVSLTGENQLCISARKQDEELSLSCDYLITAIGREPDYRFADESIMKNSAELNSSGRLYMIGDLVNGSYRQTALAVGDGVRAAMSIQELLEKEK